MRPGIYFLFVVLVPGEFWLIYIHLLLMEGFSDNRMFVRLLEIELCIYMHYDAYEVRGGLIVGKLGVWTD